MKIPFVFQTKDSKACRIFLDQTPIIFGRLGSHHNLDDHECSRRHCMISLIGNEIVVEDLESKNGTLVNGVRTSKCRIFIGDVVKIGNTKIILDDKSLPAEWVERLTFQGDQSKRLQGEITLQLENQDSSQSNTSDEKIHKEKMEKLYGKKL